MHRRHPRSIRGAAEGDLLSFRLSGVFPGGCSGSVTDANMTRLHDDKGFEEAFVLFLHHLSDSLDQGPTSIAGKGIKMTPDESV